MTFDAGSQVLHVYVCPFLLLLRSCGLPFLDCGFCSDSPWPAALTNHRTASNNSPSHALFDSCSLLDPPTSVADSVSPSLSLACRTDGRKTSAAAAPNIAAASLSIPPREREEEEETSCANAQTLFVARTQYLLPDMVCAKRNIASKVKFCVETRNCCNGTKKNTLSLTGGFL